MCTTKAMLFNCLPFNTKKKNQLISVSKSYHCYQLPSAFFPPSSEVSGELLQKLRRGKIMKYLSPLGQ